jgi:lipopolysaccharide export system protein LptA
MHRIKGLVFLLGFLFTTNIFALASDTKAKMTISADSCIYNYKLGTSVFTGHVEVNQGTTHISADKLTTKKNAQHKIEETIAYGIENLAHYTTLPKEGDELLHAYAKIIKYYPVSAHIILQETVTVLQNNNSFNGQLIHYNMNEQTITVPAAKDSRAVLVYNPEKPDTPS